MGQAGSGVKSLMFSIYADQAIFSLNIKDTTLEMLTSVVNNVIFDLHDYSILSLSQNSHSSSIW